MGRASAIIVGSSWGCFMSSLLVLFNFEKLVFDDWFTGTGDYIIVLGCILASYLATVIVLRKVFPAKKAAGHGLLPITAFITPLVVALLFFMQYAFVPTEPVGWGCDSFACSAPGQVILICLNTCVMIPVLVSWTRQALVTGDGYIAGGVAVVVTGMLSLLAGYIATLAYYHVLLVAACASGGLSALVLIQHVNGAIKVVDPMAVEGSKHATLDLLLSARSTATIVVVAVLGFSMLDVDRYPLFQQLFTTGLGLVVAGIVLLVLEALHASKAGTFVLEGVVLVLYLTAMQLLYYLMSIGMVVVLHVGIPEFITGFAFGYIQGRVVLSASGVSYPKPFAFPPMKRVSKEGASTFGIVVYVLLLAIAGIVNISTGPSETAIIYPAGFIISAVALCIWALSGVTARRKATGMSK
nr:hypothetical protein [Candidatus Sigynarchaeota archaeon]